jgi:hypothetical protein
VTWNAHAGPGLVGLESGAQRLPDSLDIDLVDAIEVEADRAEGQDELSGVGGVHAHQHGGFDLVDAYVDESRLGEHLPDPTAAAALVRKPDAAPGVSAEHAADVLFGLLSPELYLLFVRERGWEPARWEAWAFETLRSQLCAPRTRRSNLARRGAARPT